MCIKVAFLEVTISNSNLMIPDNSSFWLSQFRKATLRQPKGQRLSNIMAQQKKSIGPILFILYFEESLVSSNLNSKQHRFHGAHPRLTITKLKVHIF